MYDRGYSDTYFGRLIEIIRRAYREARDVDHLHDLRGTTRRGFITVAEVFLTVDESLRPHRRN